MEIWTIYIKGLKPYPEKHIARKHVLINGKSTPTLETETGRTVDEVRILMRQRGLVCVGREQDDDPVIIESWI